jgi:hypothetical protein
VFCRLIPEITETAPGWMLGVDFSFFRNSCFMSTNSLQSANDTRVQLLHSVFVLASYLGRYSYTMSRYNPSPDSREAVALHVPFVINLALWGRSTLSAPIPSPGQISTNDDDRSSR